MLIRFSEAMLEELLRAKPALVTKLSVSKVTVEAAFRHRGAGGARRCGLFAAPVAPAGPAFAYLPLRVAGGR